METTGLWVMLPLFTFVAGALSTHTKCSVLGSGQQSTFDSVYLGGGCFNEARRDGYNGWITQTFICPLRHFGLKNHLLEDYIEVPGR